MKIFILLQTYVVVPVHFLNVLLLFWFWFWYDNEVNSTEVMSSGGTNSYLLNREDQHECVGCACPLTVQHIMIDCRIRLYTEPFF